MKKKKRSDPGRFYVIARSAATRQSDCCAPRNDVKGITAQIKNQTNPSDKSFHNQF